MKKHIDMECIAQAYIYIILIVSIIIIIAWATNIE